MNPGRSLLSAGREIVVSHSNWLRAYLDKDEVREVDCPCCRATASVRRKRIVVVPDARLGYGVVWCEQCKKGSYISRVKFSEPGPLDEDVQLPLKIEFVDE